MMCRHSGIYLLNEILDDIHFGKNPDSIKEKCERFKREVDYESLNLQSNEIRLDRLKEYIKFFNLSYVCEYDIFRKREVFYNILKENLGENMWKDIEEFLHEGNLLCDYQID